LVTLNTFVLFTATPTSTLLNRERIVAFECQVWLSKRTALLRCASTVLCCCHTKGYKI